MFKVDLHTHSEASPDGGIRLDSYEKYLQNGTLDVIAITDHNRVDFALNAQQKLGDKIIVGEEIMTSEGEIIGLYLTDLVAPGQTAAETIKAIKAQGGLVYIPHPFETVRKGLHLKIMDDNVKDIGIIEVCNGRAFLQNRSEQAVVWARLNNVKSAASSDAHGEKGLGGAYTRLDSFPTRESLLDLLDQAKLITNRPGMRALLYPKYYRLRKKIGDRRA